MRTFASLAVAAALLLAPASSYAVEQASLEARLSLIQEKQEQILKALEEIKAELAIVKVRATNK